MGFKCQLLWQPQRCVQSVWRVSSSALSHCTSTCPSVCPLCLCSCACPFALLNYPLGTIKIDWTELCCLWMTDGLSVSRVTRYHCIRTCRPTQQSVCLLSRLSVSWSLSNCLPPPTAQLLCATSPFSSFFSLVQCPPVSATAHLSVCPHLQLHLQLVSLFNKPTVRPSGRFCSYLIHHLRGLSQPWFCWICLLFYHS